MSLDEDALRYHREPRPGKLEVVPTKPLDTQRDLSLAYSPGVAAACRAISADPASVFQYTSRGNLVAVVSNGSAVLGLGNLGPAAAKPVMEGKANLFKKFADIDVFDIELDATTADEIVAAVMAIAPTFGGINLEDIKAPECFEVERRLQERLDIPVFHDDQHGTAIISGAALINACHVTERDPADLRVVFAGAGAAAIACARHFVNLGVPLDQILMYDADGLITPDRKGLGPEQLAFARDLDAPTLADGMRGAHVFVGLAVGGIVSGDMVASMADRPLIFAMANPDPEIPYEEARAARPDAIVATGRSDHPNQVNNVLGFPFVFRGALDCQARKITEEMKLAATHAIAQLAREEVPDTVLRAYGLEGLVFGPEYLIPKPFDPRVLLYVAPAVAKAAAESGVARAPISDLDAYREHLHRLVERARGLMAPIIQATKAQDRQRIVFPDGDATSVLRAAQQLAEQRICTPVLLGDPERIRARAAELGLDLARCEIDGCRRNERHEALAQRLWALRQREGVTLATARALLDDRTWYGTLMVEQGLADGLVGGLGRPYKDTLKPALQVLGTEHPDQRISGVYAMIFEDRKVFFGDCTVNLYPDAPTLSQIALNTARVAESFGQTPRVAMLSYSDFGEHRHDPKVRTVREAVRLVREAHPGLVVEGEMQADTAVDMEKLQARFPFAALDSPANVLVFPDLTAGNIAYKLLVRLTGAEALGPLLVGLSAPVNVIPVHAKTSEIVNVATWTAYQAAHTRRG